MQDYTVKDIIPSTANLLINDTNLLNSSEYDSDKQVSSSV